MDHYDVRRWDGWVSAYDPGDVRLGVSHCTADAGGRHKRRKKGAREVIDLSVDLLPLTVPEIHHLLWSVAPSADPQATQLLA